MGQKIIIVIIIMTTTNNWNISKDNQMIIWKDICHEYSKIHDTHAEKYGKYAKIIKISSISFVATSGILSGINTYYGVQFLSIFALILAGVSTGLLSYSQNMQIDQKAVLHNNYSKKYKQLSLKIDKELAQEYHDRINGVDFIKFISTELLEYFIVNDNLPGVEVQTQNVLPDQNKIKTLVMHKSMANIRKNTNDVIDTVDVNNAFVGINAGAGAGAGADASASASADASAGAGEVKVCVDDNIKPARVMLPNGNSPTSLRKRNNVDTNKIQISAEEKENFELFFNSFPGIDLELALQKERFNVS